MEFHKYRVVSNSAQEAFDNLHSLLERRNHKRDETEKLKTGQAVENAWMEIMWHIQGRPYYRIWPDVFEMFLKTKPVESRFIEIPSSSLVIEFPKCLNLPFRSAIIQVKNDQDFRKQWLQILDLTSQRDKEQDEDEDSFQPLEVAARKAFYPEVDNVMTFDVDSDKFTSRIGPHKSRVIMLGIYYGNKAAFSRYIVADQFEPDDIFEKARVTEMYFDGASPDADAFNADELAEHAAICFKVLAGLSIIASDPDPDVDLFEEVLLAKDRKKATENPACRPKLVEKATRRQKSRGFEIGRGFHEKKEKGAPEYAVGAHFQHYWIGKRNTEERRRVYKVRRGYVVGLKEAAKVPTGYYADNA